MYSEKKLFIEHYHLFFFLYIFFQFKSTLQLNDGDSNFQILYRKEKLQLCENHNIILKHKYSNNSRKLY